MIYNFQFIEPCVLQAFKPNSSLNIRIVQWLHFCKRSKYFFKKGQKILWNGDYCKKKILTLLWFGILNINTRVNSLCLWMKWLYELNENKLPWKLFIRLLIFKSLFWNLKYINYFFTLETLSHFFLHVGVLGLHCTVAWYNLPCFMLAWLPGGLCYMLYGAGFVEISN